MNPEKNSFLLAPLAKAAGGTQKCGQPVFALDRRSGLPEDPPDVRPDPRPAQAAPRADMQGFAAVCEEQVSEP